jgi:two-component system, NtrC family, response regulator HydG
VNILVVDDEDMIRGMVAQRLGKADHQVQVAADADAAEALLVDHPEIDIVISDIYMPGRNGVELARAVRKRRPEVGVILMTGYAELETAVEAVDAQVFAYLRKPFCIEELNTVVDRLAEHIELRREREEHQKKLEELVSKLEASEGRYRGLVDGIPGAVLVTDRNLVIQSAGSRSQQILGRSPEELIGQSVDGLREREHAAECRARAEELIGQGGGVLQFDEQVLRADGSLLRTTEVVTLSEDESPGRRSPGVFWIIQDGSAAHRLKMQAEIARDYLEAVRRSRSEGKRIVGESQAIRDVLRMIKNIAPTDASVLICGESGTEKELVAESIHINSDRSEKPFVVVNCAALPESLLESELFGYKRGAFTGAVRDKRGLVEIADGGTLFVDEVAEMEPRLQAKLLRVLESGEFRWLGSTDERLTNIRVIAATNRDLAKEVKEGRFREDLLYRLDVIRMELPPLRERVVDVPLIAEHLLSHSGVTMRLPKRLKRDALDALMKYDWPGNVRELSNVLERAVILSGEGGEIGVEHLSVTPKEEYAGIRTLRELESIEIEKALALTKGNKTRAAKMLGITRQTLISRVKARPKQ